MSDRPRGFGLAGGKIGPCQVDLPFIVEGVDLDRLLQGEAGTSSSNSVALFGRASPYQGISLQTSVSYTLSTRETGRLDRTSRMLET